MPRNIGKGESKVKNIASKCLLILLIMSLCSVAFADTWQVVVSNSEPEYDISNALPMERIYPPSLFSSGDRTVEYYENGDLFFTVDYPAYFSGEIDEVIMQVTIKDGSPRTVPSVEIYFACRAGMLVNDDALVRFTNSPQGLQPGAVLTHTWEVKALPTDSQFNMYVTSDRNPTAPWMTYVTINMQYRESSQKAVDFKYAGQLTEGYDATATCYYDDAYFFRNPTDYNPQLSTMSLSLQLATWPSRETESWSNKTQNVRALLTGKTNLGAPSSISSGIGFKEFQQNDAVWTYPPTKDTIGVVAANKTIVDEADGNKPYTLIALSIRGGGTITNGLTTSNWERQASTKAGLQPRTMC